MQFKRGTNFEWRHLVNPILASKDKEAWKSKVERSRVPRHASIRGGRKYLGLENQTGKTIAIEQTHLW